MAKYKGVAVTFLGYGHDLFGLHGLPAKGSSGGRHNL